MSSLTGLLWIAGFDFFYLAKPILTVGLVSLPFKKQRIGFRRIGRRAKRRDLFSRRLNFWRWRKRLAIPCAADLSVAISISHKRDALKREIIFGLDYVGNRAVFYNRKSHDSPLANDPHADLATRASAAAAAAAARRSASLRRIAASAREG
jgi:hypothetical protein